jgi:SpoVK/Ycf46/Vps4 family AAA+-type ATPase
MSNAKQILSMLRSRADGDEERFLSIALQVAAAEARQGHRTNAEELRAAVDTIRAQRGDSPGVPVAFAQPRGELGSVLDLRDPQIRLSNIVLSPAIAERLDKVVLQQQKRSWLREHNKSPVRRLLFAGPPGSGKTMSAEGLAGELRLPLFVVRLDSLITRYMGDTAAKLRLVFDETLQKRGVYLFDEFDAVGGHRNATNDVAEMRRVLNSFLQFMEEPSATDSVIVAATNHPELLDNALQRRFDEVLLFELPSAEQVREVIKSNLKPLKFPRIAWKTVVKSAEGLSQSEIARAAEEAVKEAILSERSSVSTSDLVSQLEARQSIKKIFQS